MKITKKIYQEVKQRQLFAMLEQVGNIATNSKFFTNPELIKIVNGLAGLSSGYDPKIAISELVDHLLDGTPLGEYFIHCIVHTYSEHQGMNLALTYEKENNI